MYFMAFVINISMTPFTFLKQLFLGWFKEAGFSTPVFGLEKINIFNSKQSLDKIY